MLLHRPNRLVDQVLKCQIQVNGYQRKMNLGKVDAVSGVEVLKKYSNMRIQMMSHKKYIKIALIFFGLMR